MVVALTFLDGRVHFRARFVASKERLEEQAKRKYVYRGQMGSNPDSALRSTVSLIGNFFMMRWPRLHFRNPSNTNVFYWGGKVSKIIMLSCYDSRAIIKLTKHHSYYT